MSKIRSELPARPDLDHLRRQARRLQRAFDEQDTEARQRIAEALPHRANVAKLHLADAQCAIAREYGFPSWPRLKQHVEAAGDALKSAILAIRVGEAERLALLLAAEPALVARRDQDGWSLLHHAAASAARRNPTRVTVLNVLLDAGADVNTTLEDGQKPLHFAAGLTTSDICAALLDRGADPRLHERKGGTALHHALYFGGPEAADVLAARGPVDDNLRTAAGLGRLDLAERHFDAAGALGATAARHRDWMSPPWIQSSPASSEPSAVLTEALNYALKNRRLEIVPWLIERGAQFDPDAVKTVATSNSPELLALMLATQPDLVTPALWGFTVWQWANLSGHEELATRLKRLAARKHLPTAADLGDLELVERLLTAGADPNQTNHEGSSALALALGVRSLLPTSADGGSPEVAARLVAAGGELDFRSAARLGRLDEIERHLARGEGPQSALGAAVESDRNDIVERLVRAGAVLDLFDLARLGRTEQVLAKLSPTFDWYSSKPGSNGDTLLYQAIWGHSRELVESLLERGAPVCDPGPGEAFGKAAVHIAGWTGAERAIWELLLKHGADINHSSDPGTPFDCARMARRTETMALIRELGGVSAKEFGRAPASPSGPAT